MLAPASHIDAVDGFDLSGYRAAAATLVRLLIRARAKVEPDFLSKDQFERWGLGDIEQDPVSLPRLLRMADRAYDKLWREFIGPNGSGGVALDDPLGELKEQVTGFCRNPPHFLLQSLQQEEAIDWATAAEWKTLPAIRAGLDALPKEADPLTADKACPVQLGERRRKEVFLYGQATRVLQAQYEVLAALVAAFPRRLAKDALIRESKHGDAVGILKRLQKREPWTTAIALAGERGNGYGLVAKREHALDANPHQTPHQPHGKLDVHKQPDLYD